MLTVRTYHYKYANVFIDNQCVAIMERSPWTGEWCYGLKTGHVNEYGAPTFRPPFTPTRLKTAKAAAKVVAANL